MAGQNNASFRGIIFDMDGVLCDSEALLAEAACEMFRLQHGIQVKPEDFLPFVGTGEDRYLGGVASKYGVSLSLPLDKLSTYELYLEIIKNRLKALPGVHEFVARCSQRGLALAVATSADRVKMEGNLNEIGLPPSAFKACITGSEVKQKKPAPDIFLQASRKLGIPPASCLVIEDAPSGIEAARAAGSNSLGLTTSFSASELSKAGANWTAVDLEHIPDSLSRELFD